MATSTASGTPSLVLTQGEAPDPFVTHTPISKNRYSGFDSHMFALGPNASPTSAKRALEAHLADTERRMEEAGKLGTALVHQRQEITDRLKEVEQLETEGELTSDLKQKLMDIEKDFNEVARESARAFLPKQRVPSNEAVAGSPYVPDGGRSAARRSVSPSKFESLATGSPSKFSVPNRKIRNQPTNRIHDIEFAAEISTSLITQVRNLQALLQEREEELRDIKVDKSKLEVDAEGLQQRMKNLDESEHRYKDENWNLETQIHELIASQKEASDREKKLTQTLNVLQAERNSTQRELDEIKMNHSKLVEDHAASVKHHDIELGTAKRNAVMAESERSAMQRKIDDLIGQNQELAMAIAQSRGRAAERESGTGLSDDEFGNAGSNMTPEHSPPPSPIKATPRHSGLESETLKTSLQHAQRTIQSLRTNVHREKTEKLELKRMLQDARDEIEKMRSDPVERPHQKRAREAKSREFKKPAKMSQLGTPRAVRAEIYMDDPEWEEVASTAGRSPPQGHAARMPDILPSTESDEFETANEANDTSDAFETAHERETETDDFQTGAEEFTDSDDAETETEASPSKVGKSRRASVLPASKLHGGRYSYDSTASTSGDDDEYPERAITPTAASRKMRMRPSQGAMSRRSRQFSEEPSLPSSPASRPNGSLSGSFSGPSQHQSLFAELEDLDGSDYESQAATPSRRSIRSITPATIARGRTHSPPPAVPAFPRAIMIDSGVMTDPVEIQPIPAAVAERSLLARRPISMDSVASAIQDGDSRPLSMRSYSDAGAQHDPDMETRLAQFPSPSSSLPMIGALPTPNLAPPQRLSMSMIQEETVEPHAEREIAPPILGLSDMVFENVEPLAEPEVPPPALSLSHVVAEHVEPIAEPAVPPPALSLSNVVAEHVEPVAAREVSPPVLSMSHVITEHVEPIASPEPLPPLLSVSSILAEHVEPVAEPERALSPPRTLGFSSISTEQLVPVAVPEPEPQIIRVVERVEAPKPPPPTLAFSSISSEQVEPVAEPEQEPQIIRVVERVIEQVEMEAPKPLPPALDFSSISEEEVEPVAEPEQEPQIIRVVERVIEQVEVEAPKPLPPTLIFSLILEEQVEPVAEPEQEPQIIRVVDRVVELVEAPKPPPELTFSPLVAEGIEPMAEFEPLQPSLSLSGITSEHVEPRLGPQPAPTPLSLSSIVAEDVEPKAEPEVIAAPLSVSTIISENVEPEAEPVVLPAPLSLSSILSEHVEPISLVTLSPISFEKPGAAPFGFSTIQSVETEPIEPEPITHERPVIMPLGFSSIESVDTEPYQARSPKREAFIIPCDAAERRASEADVPKTPTRGIFASAIGWARGKTPTTPVIAEDETRQSVRSTPLAETPESQRPFREISANTDVKAERKQPASIMIEQGAQTTLTSEAIDKMLQPKPKPQAFMGHGKSNSIASVGSMGTPGTVRVQRSQDSMSSVVRSKGKMVETGANATGEAGLAQRPGSSLQNLPPLPQNHKEVIEAARTGSAHGGTGSMGPPLFPASAYRNPILRPRTPTAASIHSTNGTPTPRAVERGESAHGHADVHSPTRHIARSRKSSVSSFASEVDARFNTIHGGTGMEAHGFGPNTDPRMIQAITQTMIGEYLWKYTRKAGRGEMSEKRHRRYFWVHPYTRTLYWSDRDPSSGGSGRSELRAKSVPIEAVRVVTDDNIMPPGLHRKSLIIISPGRSIKFTCTTGQRHETWFNALSYLLLRTNDASQADTEEMAGGITREDVEEFNPLFGRRTPAGNRSSRAPASLSSYNSRTTRNESPARAAINLDVPTLTPNSRNKGPPGTPNGVQRPSMAGRFSGYWKSTHGTLSSLRSRSAVDQTSIYEASQVHDSAEDLRAMYEQQDRESDRLDNVRACCEGRHDVGTLSRKQLRQSQIMDNSHSHGHSHSHSYSGSHSHSHPTTPSTPATPFGTVTNRA